MRSCTAVACPNTDMPATAAAPHITVKKLLPQTKKLQKLTENGAAGTQNGARMHQKWIQNREKCAESPKVATRWLPRPLYREEVVDF